MNPNNQNNSTNSKNSPSRLREVILIRPNVFKDPRGYFMETYQQKRYEEDYGITCNFVQDNLSFSQKNTLRGLHYQSPNPQAKLVQVVQGEVFDVAVDIRPNSPTFGGWTSAILSDQNKHQLFVPEGFAHGFCVLSQTAIFHYKCSNYYSPTSECGILWSDPIINITWPIKNPIISKKDQNHPLLSQITQQTDSLNQLKHLSGTNK